jgi:hypothetical protein
MSRAGVGPRFGWAMSTAITMILTRCQWLRPEDRPTGLTASHVGATSTAASVVAPNVDGGRAVMSERYPTVPTEEGMS